MEHPARLRPGLSGIQHQLVKDGGAAIEAMAKIAGLERYDPLEGETTFYLELGRFALGEIELASIASSPVHMHIEHAPVVYLVAPFAGRRHGLTATGHVWTPPGGGLLLPVGPLETVGSDSAAVLALQPQALARTAAAMAGRAPEDRPWPGAGERIGHFQAQRLCGHQAQQLHSLLQHLNTCMAVQATLPLQLGLDDVLHRLVVTWLLPELLADASHEPRHRRGRESRLAFSELLDSIEANLDQSLRLSDLEARSHYSRRALQYAFQAQLGCTPLQWIRQRRLERAMEQLRQGNDRTSIQRIALACGYRHLGHFGADFKWRFGVTPSQARWR